VNVDIDDYAAMKAADQEYGKKIAGLKDRLLAYTGNFEFLLEMQAHARGDYAFTPRQIDAIERSLDKWDERNKPVAAVEPTIGALVPAGTTRHAVINAEGSLTFIRIDKIVDPKSNWNGWVFVKRIAGPEEMRIGSQKPNGEYKGQWQDLLKQINDDPIATISRYGKEIGSCGICGLRLTDKTSRELGIGPICRGKLGL